MIKKFRTGICLLFLLAINMVQAKDKDIFNVKDYGAKGDGINLDSKSINKAIDAAAKAGGGEVYLPAGNYLSGSIRLKSHIALYLEQGATVIATSAGLNNEYDAEEATPNTIYQDSGHSHFHNSLIWGDSISDISIIGPGTIWGKGLLKDWKKDSKLGNKAITLYKCRNVIIRDVSILHGGWFGILATGTDNLTIDNVKEDTNRDGMDIDCCKNVRISNCCVNSPYDDGICLKSTYALGTFRSTENVTISNCQVSGYDEGTLLDGTFKRTENAEYHHSPTGRIKFGTESNGGFKNITISNCVFDYCRGLALETVDGALLEDVSITNITMRDIVSDPIFLRLGARMRGPKGTPVGALRRVIISNVVIYNSNRGNACTISGVPGNDIEDITLDHIRMYNQGGRSKEPDNRIIPENETKYPEPGMFGSNPAYGLYARHVKNLQLSDVQFYFLKPDYRPALKFEAADDVYLHHVTMQRTENTPAISLKNVNGFSVYQSQGIENQELQKVTEKLIK